METQADFELTAEEMAELKALLEVKAGTSYYDNGTSFNLRRKLVAITDPVEFKKCLSELKSLNLVDANLINNALPDSIRYLSNLVCLSISSKLLKKFPENIKQLPKLKKLMLFCVQLTVLPECIDELSNLTELHLACPNLIMLPESIGKLSNLSRLYINASINNLPESFGQLSNLKSFHLYNANLTALPESIGQLHNLQELYLGGCDELLSLPESIAHLEKLDLFSIQECHNLQIIPLSIQQLEGFNFWDKQRREENEQKAREKNIKQLTAEQVSIVLAELHKQTAQPAVKINIQEADNLPLTASKFGGVPYWLPEMPYPVDKQGNKLLLLAQINLSEMPPLPDFPTTGLLQFLMTRNVYEMNFYDNPTRQDDWRVVYHAEINPAIDEAAVLALNIPYAPQIFDEEDDGGFPVDTQYRLSFEPAEIRIGTECIGFNQALKNAAKEVGIKLNKNDLSDLEVLFGEKAWEKIKQHTVENLIGGYPDFTQTDPRDERKYKKHSVLLLQIESDEGIMWGDCGVGNFFIRPDDLRKKDFSKVLFNWDCY
ncbi:MAG: DUF1963 domain-containing protein [Neisseriaceae bacterium]|nr:DUF1963 domain-containing protein [Neisseriaceae bacterium]